MGDHGISWWYVFLEIQPDFLRVIFGQLRHFQRNGGVDGDFTLKLFIPMDPVVPS